jgi:hypothetical protein
MKKIINLKRYDTDTAEEIAVWWNGCLRSDFNYCKETLYRTKSQSWFLHGEGGALSCYAESWEGGRSSTSGSAITPMSEAEAAAWLAQHDSSQFDQHFAHLATDA